MIKNNKNLVNIFLLSLALVTTILVGMASDGRASDTVQQAPPESTVVARVYFTDKADLDRLASTLDVWEVNHAEGYLLAVLTSDQYDAFTLAGYRLEVDPARTKQLLQQNLRLPGQGVDTIPGYPCYRTVEETYTAMQDLATNHPVLATWIDIGDSWEKVTPGGLAGYDIFALRLTNPNIPTPKPTFFLMAEIHAREYVTAETAARFAEHLIDHYGIDPDITWLLDYYQVYIVTMTNPDGRKKAETGLSWRKNTDNDDGCTASNSWGVDLNRNHSFHWGGADTYPCSDLYQGPTAASEPETQTIQNYVLTLFPDQRGPGDTDPAPLTTTGVFITLHSYSQLVLWPWGWTGVDAPNHAQLQTLGRKMAFFNDYSPQQSNDLYGTTGTSDDWAYGVLGVAAYTYEMGSTFFQDCGSFESTIYPDNLNAILEGFKAARLPYMEPSGPAALSVTATPAGISPGEEVVLTARVDDTRFSANNGTEPRQNIAAAEYYIDTPPWITDPVPVAYPMTAADGSFNATAEDVVGTLEPSGLSQGRHMLFVRGQDVNGNWGTVSAAFLYVLDPDVSPVIEGTVRDAATNQPLAATVDAGMFQASTDPLTGFFSMTVISGTYNLTAEATGYSPATLTGIVAQDYQTVNQDFYLSPTCTIFSDTVENGNQGWTAQTPWAITAEASHSATHSWTESPNAIYGNNRNTSLTSQTFNLDGYTGVALDYWQIYDTESGYDYCYVEFSNNGSTWTTVATFDGEDQTTWQEQYIPLPGLDDQANSRIRFRFTSDISVQEQGWHVDDITLVGGGAACSTPVAPTAEFTSSATTVNVGEPVQFTDLTYGTPPFTYLWDFGDGAAPSIETNPEHIFLASGTFTVTLAVTNSLGSDSVSHPITVEAGGCVPVSQVTLDLLNPGLIQPGETAHFRAGFQPDYFTRPVSYTVDFGDATPPVNSSSLDAPLLLDHIYSDLGDYTAEIDAWNCAMTTPVTASVVVSVGDFSAGLDVDPLTQMGWGEPGEMVTYTFTVTNTGDQPDLVSLALVEAAWDTTLPASVGPLDAGASASVLVTVTVPVDAMADDSDWAVLQFESAHPSVDPITATLTTMAVPVYSLEVNVELAAQDGFPGMPVTYTLHVTNTGNSTDTFTLEANSGWGITYPESTGLLSSGGRVALEVVVTVPAMVMVGTSDIAVFTLTSIGDPERWVEVSFTTTADALVVWIPLVMK